MIKFNKIVFTAFMIFVGFHSFSQDTLRTACECTDAEINVTEELNALLMSMVNEVKTDEEKAQFMEDYMRLNGTLNKIKSKCETVYINAPEDEKCENTEKLKRVKEEF
ncbi:MAG: hypothetical protein ACI837_001529 [Crocinitomicaceae bacterium]|jgi:hypothetical protein